MIVIIRIPPTKSLFNSPGCLFRLLLLICVGISLTYCHPALKENVRDQPPNIILILADDQGWGDFSFNGNASVETPNLDQMVKNGALFERFYVSPVCSPTRAELLTGRYHVRSGVYSTSEGGERFNLNELTIADVFKSNGFKTAAFGKWHSGMQPPYHPNARGFDEFYGFCSGHWGNYFEPLLEHNGVIVKGKGFIIDDLTNQAISFIDKNKADPFFVFIPYNTPHSPMQVPDHWWNKQKTNESPDHPFKDQENEQHSLAAYALCENIDWNIGRIMKKIEDLNLTDNTIIVYLSDNGPNGYRWNGGLKGIKGHTDEGGVRTPCIVQWKGKIKAGSTISSIGGAIDLLPTLTDLAGIKRSFTKPLDGISLLPLLKGEKGIKNDRYIFSYWNKKTSLRDDRFMMDASNQLFDLQNDPGQLTVVNNEFPEKKAEMMVAKSKWQFEVLSKLNPKRKEVFPVGHPDFQWTQLPARDAKGYGNIQRSNRWPNSSYFTHWNSTEDSIVWDVDILSDGHYEAIIYYTCAANNIGSTISINNGNNSLIKKLSVAHSSEFLGEKFDRVTRQESFEKDFISVSLGTMNLSRDQPTITLKAIDIPGDEVMDFRLLMLRKI